MGTKLVKFYRHTVGENVREELCFYVQLSRKPTKAHVQRLRWSFIEHGSVLTERSIFAQNEQREIGPRVACETPFSSNAVAICQRMGVPAVRVECSTRYSLTGTTVEDILAKHLDKMTQEVYDRPLTTFDSGAEPKPVRIIPLIEQGEAALVALNKELGLGMDPWDMTFCVRLFRDTLRRNPTDVELFQIANGNSEHSRHHFWRGIQKIDGIEMPESLMDIVKEPLKRHPGNVLVAFHDNAGVIRGAVVDMLVPEHPGAPSSFVVCRMLVHYTKTGETHNHPTLISAFAGATTGAGGRIRDSRAVGRGGLGHAGFAGYFVGNLLIPDYPIPGEPSKRAPLGGYNPNHETPLNVLIKGSRGVKDYGNKIGEPLIGGWCRSFGLEVGGERREAIKPVLWSAGSGLVLDQHIKKNAAEIGMIIVRIGGVARRIGVGGGSASSISGGSQNAELDLKSVQRGDPQTENRVNRVIQTCAESGDQNPIESIHDQGAGGPSNVLTELSEPLGGRIQIRKIVVGDKTMSVLEIWVAEYQEGYGLLVRPENLAMFQAICERENVNCEVLGTITGDKKIVVEDSVDSTTPVDLPLEEILGSLPRKTFEHTRIPVKLTPLVLPKGLTVAEALEMIFKLVSVGSKGFLIREGDRGVGGCVVQQQCCGPMQIPVADAAVMADGFFGITGHATAIGEQPIKMLVNPAAGARMAVAEVLTNLAGVSITKLSDVAGHANWMWTAKLPGEGARLYDAAVAMRDIMIKLRIKITGGKDSLSMADNVDGTPVKTPGQLVISANAPVPDITKIVTPDLKGDGFIGLIDLGGGKNRLGGSALAQALGQVGDESPDIDDPDLLKRAFEAIQELVAEELITAYHNRSDGGLITTLAEMCMAAGNRGMYIELSKDTDAVSALFSEEAGMVFEYERGCRERIYSTLAKHNVPFELIGTTGRETPNLTIYAGGKKVLDHPITQLRRQWEATSDRLELEQSNPETVAAECATYADGRHPIPYRLTFTPSEPPALTAKIRRPKVAVIREEGTNGDREMAAALKYAGFDPVDINMNDLLSGRVKSLEEFQGLVFPGGFSFADAFGSAKGWAGSILFNARLRKMFDRFYTRPDTFSLGVCNGFQLMTLLGWLPGQGVKEASQPRLVHNLSGRFEVRWTGVKILPSSSILLRGMEGSILGVPVAHGEGRLVFPDPRIAEHIRQQQLVPFVYVDPDGNPTEAYPHNPNGSPEGFAALCSANGRHTGMMPHPERVFLNWQHPYRPPEWAGQNVSPWLQMFNNAHDWCLKH